MRHHALHPPRTRDLVLVFIPPAVWAAHFLVTYVSAAVWCARFAGRAGSLGSLRGAVAVYTAVALLVIVTTGVGGYRRHYHPEETPPHDADTPADRERFLGLATALLAGLSVIATIYVAAIVLIVHTCV